MKPPSKKLLSTAVALLTAMSIAAALRVTGVTGRVTVRQGNKAPVAATVGMTLSPGDHLDIADGAVLEILNENAKSYYTSTSTGSMTVSRMIGLARSEAADNVGAVHDNLRFGRTKGRDRDSRVYVESGMVTRSLATYDPEASGITMDPATLSGVLYRMLTSTAAAPDDRLIMTHSSDDTGMRFTLDNVMEFPLYFNIIRIADGADSKPEAGISALGQPDGCYVLLPGQSISRATHDTIPAGERHLLVATHCRYDIDCVIENINTQLREGYDKPDIDFDIYVRDINAR